MYKIANWTVIISVGRGKVSQFNSLCKSIIKHSFEYFLLNNFCVLDAEKDTNQAEKPLLDTDSLIREPMWVGHM